MYLTVVTIHVLAALLWLGGMFFLGAVGAPVLRNVEPPELRQSLFHALGLRFRTVGWIAIGILVVTGLLQLHLRGFLNVRTLGSGDFWMSPFGHTLAIKLLAVTVMLIASAVHDFALGPQAGLLTPGSNEATQLRKRAAMLARINALVGIVVVVAAVRLARGA